MKDVFKFGLAHGLPAAWTSSPLVLVCKLQHKAIIAVAALRCPKLHSDTANAAKASEGHEDIAWI